MKIYDETKTYQISLETIDFEKGYLKLDKLFVKYHETVEAKEAVYDTVTKKLDNGSKETYHPLISPAVEAKEAYDEYEDIQVFVLYTETELAQREILKLKQQLSSTDYQAIKYAEGEMSEEEYAEVKEKRRAWRERINVLE